MLCTHRPWVQASTSSYPPQSKQLNQSSNFSITKTKTQFQRKFLRNRLNDIEVDDIDDDDGGSGLLRFALTAHVKSITSTSNPFVKHCLKLKNSSSYRHSNGSALVVGTTSIREIYRYEEASQEKTVMDCLLLLDKAEIPEGLDTDSVRIVRINTMVMKKLSGVQSAESIEAIALMRLPTSFLNLDIDQNTLDCRRWFPSTYRILVLDGIQDPGNLGTLVRSATAFQWDGIFLLPGCCDPFNEKALRASRGSSFQLPIVSGSWYHLQTLKDTLNMKMVAGHPDSDGKLKKVSSLSKEFVHSLSHVPLCLVLGSEGRGLSEKSQQECELVSIPMAGEFESLNVSVAGGIFLYMLQPKN
ncbi:uncharacterized protein LOC111291871 [Durio zibethinus]|uniref:Uncharacterized protein LOC111291871 n=1 Tax=Durio zibethinus TaxID=66656 RepID=A0A6P5YHZ4_DURZI|nr:uncharacterized protein LOC111291871 [Durio zibethinus]